MKKFLKLIWTLEHPFGEIWVVVFGSVILFTLGFFDLETALSFIITAVIFAVFVLAVYFLVKMWKKLH